MSSAPTTKFLCEVSIELDPVAPIAIGQSPWRNRRISDIAGGRFEGAELSGRVCRSGADWSEGGRSHDGGIATALDVRSLWQTHDGASIYVTYAGRLVVPAAMVDTFRDPKQIDQLAPEDYYFRICPLFETADERYAWLNEIVAIGVGRRTSAGVTYRIHLVE